MCTKENEQFKHSSRSNTVKTLHKYIPWYLHQIQTYFVSRPQGLHSARARPKVWLINGRYFSLFVCLFIYFFQISDNDANQRRNLWLAWFPFSRDRIERWNTAKQKHRFHLDNLPIHSATCCCYEYDGVLLLMLIITVLVIINNYLMMWCSFTWWDLSVYCF